MADVVLDDMEPPFSVNFPTDSRSQLRQCHNALDDRALLASRSKYLSQRFRTVDDPKLSSRAKATTRYLALGTFALTPNSTDHITVVQLHSHLVTTGFRI